MKLNPSKSIMQGTNGTLPGLIALAVSLERGKKHHDVLLTELCQEHQALFDEAIEAKDLQRAIKHDIICNELVNAMVKLRSVRV